MSKFIFFDKIKYKNIKNLLIFSINTFIYRIYMKIYTELKIKF